MQTDDSPTTQNRMPPVMVNIKDHNAKDITKLIGSEFGYRLILKLAPKHLKCTALDNQSYQDLITYLQNNELNFYKTTPESMRSLKVVLKGLPVNTSSQEIEDERRYFRTSKLFSLKQERKPPFLLGILPSPDSKKTTKSMTSTASFFLR
ncbi:hypothetical protein CEXT_657771 [Caerostris extrusa]|uniref:LAGLIDADG homing endonuclease n=1 Tax=Caerostris extrusa TaxID=172846 RepID=A0AAV4WUD0_CAEEX|nr:hypothetical protein CEXT_657771 [Caerostris extrusa]